MSALLLALVLQAAEPPVIAPGRVHHDTARGLFVMPPEDWTAEEAETGDGLQGATVFIYTAAVRTGTSPYCPSCYPDCGKRATTNADGRFRIQSLDPSLIFRILIVAEGYEPTFKTQVDPIEGDIEVQLSPHDPDRFHPERSIRGKVVDHEGEPVIGATISTRGIVASDRVITNVVDADPIAISNERGEFVLTIGEGALCVDRYLQRRNMDDDTFRRIFPGVERFTMAAIIDARNLAKQYEYELTPGENVNVIRLKQGVMVTGRAVDPDGSPLDGIEIGLMHTNRGMGHFLGEYTIGTHRSGRFEIPNLPAHTEFAAYGKMSTMKDGLAIPARIITTDENGAVQDLGTLRARRGTTVRGRIVLADDGTIPPDTRLLLSREDAWDSQAVELATDGSFEYRGVPNEPVSISLRLRGYHLSLRNPNIDPWNPNRLLGTVHDDMDELVILFEPGEVDGDDLDRQRQATQMHHVMMRQPLRAYAE
jgi:protocatechuate 3,4-dioxygenase beta subunit